VRPEYQRARRAVGEQLAKEQLRGLPGDALVGQPRLLRQRPGRQPLQQLQAHRADDAKLREVHVRVDQPRQQDRIGSLLDVRLGVHPANLGVGPGGQDPPVCVERHRAIVKGLKRGLPGKRVAGRMEHLAS